MKLNVKEIEEISNELKKKSDEFSDESEELSNVKNLKKKNF